MWGFIAFIIIIAIAFGVTLHEAFWGIVGVGAALCAILLLVGTKVGHQIVRWAIIIIGCFIVYDGVMKIATNSTLYKKDLSKCEFSENDPYYYSAKVYTGNGQSYYDKGKVLQIEYNCRDIAQSNKRNRENWWWLEAGAGAFMALYCYLVFGDKNKQKQKSEQKAKGGSKTPPKQ